MDERYTCWKSSEGDYRLMMLKHLAGVCPHCKHGIRALGVLRISRRTPYRCPACSGLSVIPPKNGIGLILGWSLAVGLLGAGLERLYASSTLLFLFCAVASCLLPWIFARLCRFERAT